MYNRRVPAEKMSASSEMSSMYKASFGRLNNRAWPGVHAGTWCALNNTGQWLQIDLGYLHVITGVATQGRNSTSEDMWVETYELSFSKEGKTWEVYKENNITRVCNCFCIVLLHFRTTSRLVYRSDQAYPYFDASNAIFT